MKDYILQIKDVRQYRKALKADIRANKGWGAFDERGKTRLNLGESGIIPSKGNKVVSLVRLTDVQRDWVLSLPHTRLLGEAADIYIESLSDITWESGGRAKYYQTHSQDKTKYADRDGNEHELVPPVLHCALSK